ncbi:hypothetical protein SCUCBS95973_001716 [Sporothrix curviconia]|uniref:Uncharacterized protein n=1 Tax=Sporothrix curviconia TaxID=1260050 RepID=A0ABP0B0W2_9PEZI
MSSLPRSLTAAPRAGRTTARWYSQSAVTAGAVSGSTGGMMGQPRRVALLPPAPCTCGSVPSASMVPCLPLQTRRGAARAKRSPTVRRNERLQQQQQQQQQKIQGNGGSWGGNAAAATSGSTPDSIFPNDLTPIGPALDYAISAQDSVLTRDECLEVLEAVRRILRDKIKVTEESLLRDHNVTPYKMHTVATLLFFAGGGGAAEGGAQWTSLATSMLHLAATVAGAPGGVYMPSVLTILHMFGVDSPDKPQSYLDASARMRRSQLFQNAEKQFLAYLAKENTSAVSASASSACSTDADLVTKANAFTLAGMLAEASGELARGLRWYNAAWEVGWQIKALRGERLRDASVDTATISPRAPRWDWEQQCLESLGRLQLNEALASKSRPASAEVEKREQSMARYNDAVLALCTAGLALGSGKAGMFLVENDVAGRAEPSSEHDAQMLDALLLRSVMSSEPGAAELVAKREAAKVQASKTRDEAAFHGLMAEQWQKLAAASAQATMSQTQS